MLPFKRFLDSLSEEKRHLIKDLGFDGLLELKIQQHRNQKIEELMRRFDPEIRTLVVHGRGLLISEDDVGRIMGLPAGTKDISMLKNDLGDIRETYNLDKKKKKGSDSADEKYDRQSGMASKFYFACHPLRAEAHIFYILLSEQSGFFG